MSKNKAHALAEKRLVNLRGRVELDGMLRQEGNYTKSDVVFLLGLLDQALSERYSVRVVDASSVAAPEGKPPYRGSTGRGWSDKKV